MHRFRTLIATLALLAPVTALAGPDPAAPVGAAQAPGGPRVRPHDRRSAALLLEGLRLSDTLRALVRQLEERNVIVYVEMQNKLRGRRAGTLTWVTATEHFRYVRISINPDLRGGAAVSTLGHELQHALEVADAPSIVDARSLAAFYREHGISTSSQRNDWDSQAARLVGDEIRRDLATARNGYVAESVQDFDPRQWHIVYRRAREGAR